MQQSIYLVQDDDSQRKSEDQYTEHKFTIKAEADQTVYIKAHGWPDRTYPKSCRNQIGNK